MSASSKQNNFLKVCLNHTNTLSNRAYYLRRALWGEDFFDHSLFPPRSVSFLKAPKTPIFISFLPFLPHLFHSNCLAFLLQNTSSITFPMEKAASYLLPSHTKSYHPTSLLPFLRLQGRFLSPILGSYKNAFGTKWRREVT